MRFIALLILIASLVGAVGCSGKSEPEFGDKPEDWKKSTPPPGWKGPGQPGATAGGPPAGAATSPGIKPPGQ
jgi:hypothetical protein